MTTVVRRFDASFRLCWKHRTETKDQNEAAIYLLI